MTNVLYVSHDLSVIILLLIPSLTEPVTFSLCGERDSNCSLFYNGLVYHFNAY